MADVDSPIDRLHFRLISHDEDDEHHVNELAGNVAVDLPMAGNIADDRLIDDVIDNLSELSNIEEDERKFIDLNFILCDFSSFCDIYKCVSKSIAEFLLHRVKTRASTEFCKSLFLGL